VPKKKAPKGLRKWLSYFAGSIPGQLQAGIDLRQLGMRPTADELAVLADGPNRHC
jgi:hypothetical protein